jgi:hypothetical protein
MRKVILHYHLFKNAGTSIDAMLKRNFGIAWVTREFHGGHGQVLQQVADWVRTQPDAVAFSSHTALLPPPRGPMLESFPVIFVRHPIDRIASAYAFERRQGGDGFGAVLARHTTLAGYIEVRLSMQHDGQCRNFHCYRLAQMFGADTGNQAERALRAAQTLPFVGLVEAYDASIQRMTEWLKPHFPQITPVVTATNVSRDPEAPLEVRLAQVRTEIGDALYRRLEAINAADFAVYDAVRARYPAVAEGA